VWNCPSTEDCQGAQSEPGSLNSIQLSLSLRARAREFGERLIEWVGSSSGLALDPYHDHIAALYGIQASSVSGGFAFFFFFTSTAL
jgi:hypothetical protein